MSLASAFTKQAGGGSTAVAFVPPVIVSAPPPAPPKGERRHGAQEGGRKRPRSEMEGSGRRRGDDSDDDDEGRRPSRGGKPRRAKETQERADRTVFVGHIPVSWNRGHVADLFQKRLNEAREKGEFVVPVAAAADKADEKVEDEEEEYAAGDSSDTEDEDDVEDGAADDAAAPADGKAPSAKRAKKEEGAGAADAEGAADTAKADTAAKPAEKKKAKKLTRDIESIRFRSVPVAALAVAPGSDFRVMAKAAYIKKSFSNDAGGTMNAYVVFTSSEAVRHALKLNNTRVEGKVVLSTGEAGKAAGKAEGAAAAAAVAAAPSVHHLRVDRVRPDGKAKYDPKRTVFVGQVHFEAKEEELRAFFASKVSGGDGSIEGVRIVRDPATLKGKGIAYVLFGERTHVAEALGANGASFRGRTLRVTRCVDTEKASANSTYRATHAAGLPQMSAAKAAQKRLFAKTSAGRRERGEKGASGAAGAGDKKPPSAFMSSSRPAHMGATGDEVVRTKVALKVDAHHRKKAKFVKAKAEGRERAKAKHQQRKEGGRPAVNSKGEKVKSILKK